MGSVQILVFFYLGILLGCVWCQYRGDEDSSSGVYIVTLKQAPASHYNDHLKSQLSAFEQGAPGNVSRRGRHLGSRIHDLLLRRVLKEEKYLKLYSYQYLINGFAVLVNSQQADKLSRRREVANVVLDFPVRTSTTYTPQFLGLPRGAWPQEGGYGSAGEGVVIGFIDTGIDPTHPSFSDELPERPYTVPRHFSGICEVTKDFPSKSCNGKIVGARHFAASAITQGVFNASQDYASPFDGDGHGTLWARPLGNSLSGKGASIASGNHGVPVVVAGHHFGKASGIAPRSHIAVYKALYNSFGGFAADVVAAIEQAAQDGVDIINLSITANRHPLGIATFFNPIDMALLSAVKAGIFVVQAAGNTGPSPKSMSSFSPWIFTVGAATHDRIYCNSIVLGNNVSIAGAGLAPGTGKDRKYTMISAIDAANATAAAVDLSIGECQEANTLNKTLVKQKLLICFYTIRFVLGISTIKQALETAKNLSAAGVVFYMDPFAIGFQINPTPMRMPAIIIPSPNDSKILLQYYNSSLEKDKETNKIVRFGASARILGGLKASYTHSAPKVMYYSARGPDPKDSFLDNADILKPNLVAPGDSIWGAWSSLGTNSIEFQGENFAIMSGTSMAAPHVAGLAALIKQKYPTFSPSAIGSALSTTASLYYKKGGPIMAQRSYATPDLNQSPATPFDMGSGFVNGRRVLDPGLIFYSGYGDYISFLCCINGSAPVVLNYTTRSCATVPPMIGRDLNLPSITLARLEKSTTVQRTVTNIARNETYKVGWSDPYGVSIKVHPTHFSIGSGERLVLSVKFTTKMNSSAASFGRIGLFGHRGHVVNIPLLVIVKVSYKHY